MQDGEEDGGSESTYGDSPTVKGDHNPLTGFQVIILVVIILWVTPSIILMVGLILEFLLYPIIGDASSFFRPTRLGQLLGVW